MAKPFYYLCLVSGEESQKFQRRWQARAFRAVCKMRGVSCIIQAVGF